MIRLRYLAVLETFFLLVFFVAVNFIFGDGKRWVTEDLHPFWIVILLITVQYGTIEGIIAVVLSTIALYLFNLPPQGLEESSFMYNFRLIHLPFYWFVTAFFLGELRMRSFYANQELKNQLVQAKKQAVTISDEYEKVKKVKEALEERVAGEMKTLSNAYQALKNLEMMSPAKILLSLNDLVMLTLSPRKFSIWAFGSNGFEAMICHGWEKEDSFERRLDVTHPIYKSMLKNMRMFSVINKDDEDVLQNQGVLAAPLIDAKTQGLFGMIKIEEIDFYSLNLSNLEIFNTLCELIGRAFSDAREWKAIQGNMVYSHQDVYSRAFVKTFAEVAMQFGVTGTLIQLKVDGTYTLVISHLNKHLPEKTLTGQSRQDLNEFVFFIPGLKNPEQLISTLLNSLSKEIPDVKCHFKIITEKLKENVKK